MAEANTDDWENETLPEEGGSFYRGCPYLGLEEDRHTRLLFPSPVGFCYRARPAGPVKLGYQQTHCLTAVHRECPVFQQTSRASLPRQLTANDPAISEELETPGVHWRSWLVLVVAVVLVALLLGGRGWWAGLVVSQPTATAQAMAVAEAVPPTASTPILPSPTPIPPPPTQTLRPTATATATATPSATPTFTPSPTAEMVTAVFLNLYAAPQIQAAIVQKLEATPQAFTVVSRTTDGRWLEVCCVNQQSVWLAQSERETGLATATAFAIPRVNIINDLQNIRQAPSLESAILDTVGVGASYEITGQTTDGWWQVCCVAGSLGWVFGESVAIAGETTAVPVITPAATP